MKPISYTSLRRFRQLVFNCQTSQQVPRHLCKTSKPDQPGRPASELMQDVYFSNVSHYNICSNYGETVVTMVNSRQSQNKSYSRPEHLLEFKHLLDIIDLLLPRAIPAGLSVLPSHGGKKNITGRTVDAEMSAGDPQRFSPLSHAALPAVCFSFFPRLPRLYRYRLTSVRISLKQLNRFDVNSSERRVRACHLCGVLTAPVRVYSAPRG